MFQKRFSIGVWTEVSGIDRTDGGNDYSFKLHLHPNHYQKLTHVKTECNRGEGVEGGARCPAYGF